MKGPDEAEDFVYLLDEQWQCVIERDGLGLQLTGSNFLLNSGTEFLAVDSTPMPPLLGFRGFARAAKLQGKFVDVERGFRVQDQGDPSRAISVELDKTPIRQDVIFTGKKDSSATSMPLHEPIPPNGCSVKSSTASRSYSGRLCAAAFPRKGCCKDLAFGSSPKHISLLKTCNLQASRRSFSAQKEGLIGASFSDRILSVDGLLLLVLLLHKIKQTFERTFASHSCSTTHRAPRNELHKHHAHRECQLDIACSRPDDHSTRGKSTNANFSNVKKQGRSELLGEALCRAQTRARRAEKLAAQALVDKEKIVKLLFREAQTICTYKQRAHALELENMLLRKAINMDMEVRNGSPYRISEKHTGNLLKKGSVLIKASRGHRVSSQNKEWKRSQKHSDFSCTLGLAFVLGMSIAGAGLMLGWSMGWILFSM